MDDTGFLVRLSTALFVVLHRPADRPPFGSLTVCISQADEGHVDVMDSRLPPASWPTRCSDYFPENALRTTAAAGFGVPFSWNKP